jgi:putative sugar O-methyltransferase
MTVMKNMLSDLKGYLSRLNEDPRTIKYFEQFPLNRFWASENMKFMKSCVEKSDSLQEIIHEADRSFLFSINENNLPNQLAVEWQVRNMKINLQELEIEESKYSLEENSVYVKDKKLSPDFLRCLAISETITKKITFQEPVVLEIGGGLGHLARIIALKTNSKRYVIVDIAETLAFSYAFLILNFGVESVHLYDPDKTQISDLSKSRFILCPLQYFEEFPIKNYDLCINTASIGEMHHKSQNYWFDQIQRVLVVKYFYSLNRYLNSIKIPEHLWRIEENQANTGWNKNWKILAWQMEPEFCRNPYVDTQIARYLEIYAELQPANEKKFHEEAFLTNISNQDWYRFKNTDLTMTYLDVQNLHDFSTSGTLFAIWDALRLTNYTNISALSIMIEYLNFLQNQCNYFYEEYFFYIQKIEDLGFSKIIDELHRGNRIIAKKLPILVYQDQENNYVFMDCIFYKLQKNIGDIRLEELNVHELKKIPQAYSLQNVI